MIMLTGATGTVGSELMARLARDGVRARALAHSAAGRAAIESAGHEAVDGDLDDVAGLATTFEGCERLFLLSPPHLHQAHRERRAVDAARDAGISHVVSVSIMGADPDSPSPLARWHAEVDTHLAASGLGHTILRPAGFYRTHLWPVATVRREGRWYGMTGDGAAAFIDPADIADAAAAALTADTHETDRVVEVTGPEAISMPRAAAEMSEELGRTVTYVEVPDGAVRMGLAAGGFADWLVDAIIALYQAIRAGYAETVTDGVQLLTGRRPTAYRDFVRAHRGELDGT